MLLENCRVNKGEKKNVEETAKKYAALCDVFVMDAFGTAHRAEASTYGIAQFAPVACAGLLLTEELDALDKALANPARPMVAIVGGSKVSTKLTVLEALSEKVDQLVVGGGIANTFLAATGKNVGKSLCEHDLIPTAKALMEKMTERGATIPIAVDVVCGKQFDANEPAVLKDAGDVADDDMIFDIGPKSAQELADIIMKAGTVVWNGPVGVFEFDQFGEGTKTIVHGDRQRPRLHPGRRRRHHRRDPEVRHLRQGVLHLHRRRRFPGIPGRQGPACRGDPGKTRQRLIARCGRRCRPRAASPPQRGAAHT